MSGRFPLYVWQHQPGRWRLALRMADGRLWTHKQTFTSEATALAFARARQRRAAQAGNESVILCEAPVETRDQRQ